MKLSITDNILNLQQSPTSKRFLRVQRCFRKTHDINFVSHTLVYFEGNNYDKIC